MDPTPVVIDLHPIWAVCSVCGADTPSRWGVPRHNGDLVSNAWPGEWAASPACEKCFKAHAAGLLVTCDQLYAERPAPLLSEIYKRAADATGKTPSQLRAMAEQVFGSMLRHALEAKGVTIWTVARVDGDRLDVEVNVPRRSTAAEAALRRLVQLKDLKDSQGKTAEYEAGQPVAWTAAREALSEGKK